MTITTGRDDSVLEEHRRSGSGADDFPKRYEKAKIDADFLAVEAVKRFRVAAQPLLYFNPARTAVVCDEEAFPAGLNVVDATSLGAGEGESIGFVSSAVVEELGMQNLAEFLIRSDVVQTWVHIESNLEMTDIADDFASFSGHHVFFTNEENRCSLAFTIRLTDSGELTVQGD
ncbi:MAG: hypothetical protein ACI8UO_002416 [Verrucomicrobiales bacterium]|jgi:hypothetical protein